MTSGHNQTHEREHQDDRHHHHGPAWKRLHRDWRTWAVVAVMLIAIAAYVLTNSESWQPGGRIRQPMPAAGGP
jgi:ABC-type Zn2+ transport system substrate-binding protein/surface adhesin